MIYNPITKSLYTDSKQLIKNMHCPYRYLSGSIIDENDFCKICEHTLVDSAKYSDEGLLQLLREEPNTCLKVNFNQDNIRISHHV